MIMGTTYMSTAMQSLKMKFYLFFILFVIALFSVVAATSVMQIQTTTSTMVSIAGQPILARITQYINGDDFERLVQTLDPNDPFFIDTQEVFRRVKNETHVYYLYAMAVCSEGFHRFIFDGEDPESEYFSPLGEIEDVSDYDQGYFLTYATKTMQFTHLLYETTS